MVDKYALAICPVFYHQQNCESENARLRRNPVMNNKVNIKSAPNAITTHCYCGRQKIAERR